MPDKLKEGWHLDKRVPVSLILAIIIQTVGFVWFLSDLDNRVDNNTDAISEAAEEVIGIEQDLSAIRRTANSQSVSLGRIDVQLNNIEAILNRIENRYERDQQD